MKEKKKKIERLTPEQLDANYHKYIKGQDHFNNNGKELFERVLKKAIKKK